MTPWILASLPQIAARLRLPEGGAPWAQQLDEAVTAAPAEAPTWLTPTAITEACQLAGMNESMTAAAVALGRRVQQDAALRTMLWYYHHCMFLAVPYVFEANWPLLNEALGDDAGMFQVLVVLSATEQVQEIHRRRGIPADVTRETLSDLAFCLATEDYTEQHGRWGLSIRIMSWLSNHYRGQTYRLGRLQFVHASFADVLRAYRHRRDGTVVALSEAGVRYRADGQYDGAGGVEDPQGAWTSELVETAEGVEGYPIHPAGYAVHRRVRLASADWAPALARGDGVLDMHIPAGSPMDFDECVQSLRRATEFFPRHFPEQPFVGFDCRSWLLDGQFDQLLPTTSNLVRFQRQMYLFPQPGQTSWVTGVVFGRRGEGTRTFDIAELPRKTTMQRAFAEHLERGGHFRAGGCFLLTDDLAGGLDVYRRQKLPW